MAKLRQGGTFLLVVLIATVSVSVPGVDASHYVKAVTPAFRHAADPLSRLGGPASAAFPGVPLGRIWDHAPNLKKAGKTEFLWFGDRTYAVAAAERWPVVKALAQFGTFHGLEAVETAGNGISTYDWTHATYTSRYLAFVRYDDLSTDPVTHKLLHLSKNLVKLIARSQRYCNTKCDDPFIYIGHYFKDGDGLSPGEFQDPQSSPLPFTTIQHAMQAGYEHHYSQLVYDLNAETNALSALICHADGSQPKAACGRKVIKKLMKHLK